MLAPGSPGAGIGQRISHAFSKGHGILLLGKVIHSGEFPRGKIQVLTKKRERGQVTNTPQMSALEKKRRRHGRGPEGAVSYTEQPGGFCSLGCWEPLKDLEGNGARQ